MHHPWRRFRELVGWTLQVQPLPHGTDAKTHWPSRTVIIDVDLRQAQRRSAICHESIHIERGPVPDHPVLAAREEAAVEREAARRMIDIHDLGEALAWSLSMAETAEELWVDLDLLEARLTHLQSAETHYLRRRLAGHEGD